MGIIIKSSSQNCWDVIKFNDHHEWPLQIIDELHKCSLLMRVKKENENAGLKFNIKKTKIMASTPITSWQILIEVEKAEAVTDYIFLGSKGFMLQIIALCLNLNMWWLRERLSPHFPTSGHKKAAAQRTTHTHSHY